MKELDYDFKTLITMAHNCLIVTFPSEISNDEIELSSKRIILRAHSNSLVGVVFDLSMVAMLDSFIFTYLLKTSKIIYLMGAKVVWIGMRPGVVSSLLDLGVEIEGIKTAIDLQQGLSLLLGKSKFR